jgi:hypothetical protein
MHTPITASDRETLLGDEVMTNDLMIDGRYVREYSCTQFKNCSHDHSNDTVVGYVVRLTVKNGIVLRRGVPDARGIYVVGYDVDATESYVDARAIVQSHLPDTAAIDGLFRCGCRVN